MRSLTSLCRSSWLSRTRREAPHSILFSNTLCTDNSDGVQSSRIKIFDRHFRRKQLDRAAWLMRSKDSFVDTVAENILDRLEDCKKTFPTALCLGGSLEAVRRLLRGRGAIERLIMMSTSHDMVKLCRDAEHGVQSENIETSFMVGDEEFLPVKERELRIACTVAQMEREGGISPRISPLAQVRDAGNLLTRAGFSLPGVDVDEFVVRYPSALDLVEHLRAMGETNALLQRNTILKRETALATAAIYDSMFAAEDGTIPATFQVIYMTGWRDHPSQQRAKRRGSATVSFQDIQKQFGSES
ncbi:putative methyltransferase At1g22800, mitochondrial isoform X3 [Prunus dulcis]|uniref:putative methyltransferase At1g22800, mitochondrial isoform X3 n=1 Tax=Prunus dulcis TaxID=3755 RepID=UPI0014827315|nr:putative methyltransferase At1g22800, mitochondrial isoform X3 [Prunus dulcis]